MACDTVVQIAGTESDGSINVGKFGSRKYLATKFVADWVGGDKTICAIGLTVHKEGTPTTHDLTVGIWGHDAVNDEPETTDQIDMADAVLMSTFPASGSEAEVIFGSNLSAVLSHGTTYWAVLIAGTVDADNYAEIHRDDGVTERICADTDGLAWDEYLITRTLMFTLYEESGVAGNPWYCYAQQ